MSSATEAVLQNHLQAFPVGVDAIMEDYADDSILVTHDATYRGAREIRRFFTALVDGLPDGFFDAFKLTRQVILGDTAYILWEAKPWFLLATDTLVVRGGKIQLQTFAAYTPSP